MQKLPITKVEFLKHLKCGRSLVSHLPANRSQARSPKLSATSTPRRQAQKHQEEWKGAVFEHPPGASKVPGAGRVLSLSACIRS